MLAAFTTISDITNTVLPCCMKTTSRILQFFYYDYFEDLSAPTTFAKNFGFLAGVVSKIFVIKHALATNCNVMIEIITKNQFFRDV